MYDEPKRFSEACTMAYHRERGADTRIIRIFNTYGPRMDPYDGRVVISFIRQALNDEPITVFGEGKQTRSLCYVSDLVRGINLMMEGDFHEPINLGNPQELTILDIAREILALIPESKSQIVHRADAAGRPAGALPGHHAGQADPRLVAQGRAARGPGEDDRVLPGPAGECAGKNVDDTGSRIVKGTAAFLPLPRVQGKWDRRRRRVGHMDGDVSFPRRRRSEHPSPFVGCYRIIPMPMTATTITTA